MAFSLQPPPVDADVAELYQWCFRLWEWLQVPERPCFLATPSGNQSNIATDSWVTAVWGTEVFDIDANFASNTFTAPIAGKYLLSTQVRLEQIDSASTRYLVAIKTSNRWHYLETLDPTQFAADVNYFSMGGAVVTDMDAGDTADVRVYQASGTQQTDISQFSYFSGVLVAR